MGNVLEKCFGELFFQGFRSFLGPYWVRWGSSECQSEYVLILKLQSKFFENRFLVENKKVSGGSFRRVFGPGVRRVIPDMSQLVF